RPPPPRYRAPGAAPFGSLESRRSARSCPPVWQVGQYCRDESLKETSRTVSPHTGHGRPALPRTRIPILFSALSLPAASPCERSTAELRVSAMAAHSAL